jgi:hypothetical protein
MLLLMLWFGCMLEQNDYTFIYVYIYIIHIPLLSFRCHILFIASVSTLVQAVELSVVIVVICLVWLHGVHWVYEAHYGCGAR